MQVTNVGEFDRDEFKFIDDRWLFPWLKVDQKPCALVTGGSMAIIVPEHSVFSRVEQRQYALTV